MVFKITVHAQGAILKMSWNESKDKLCKMWNACKNYVDFLSLGTLQISQL